MTPDGRLVTVRDEEDARDRGLVYLGELTEAQQKTVEEAMGRGRNGRRALKQLVGATLSRQLAGPHRAAGSSKQDRNRRKRERRSRR